MPDNRRLDNRLKKDLNLSDLEYSLLITQGLKYCRKCKEWKALNSYHQDTTQSDGKYSVCKECKSLFHTKRYRPFNPIVMFKQYKANALKRELVFELSINDFEFLSSCRCTYCNRQDMNLGYDRIDSSKGYINSNITPCCTICNFMKGDLPLSSWFEQMRLILANTKKGD